MLRRVYPSPSARAGRPATRGAPSTTLARDVLVLGLIWGTSVICQRFAVGEIDPLHLMALRMLAGVLFFVPFVPRVYRALAGRPRLGIDLLLIGTLNPASTGILTAVALIYASSGVVAVLASLSPVFTALLARLVLREPPLRRGQIGGLAVAFAGVAVLILTRSTGLGGMLEGDLRGHGLALATAALMAVATTYSRLRLRGIDPLAAAAGQLSAGLLPLLPLMALAAPPLALPSVSGAVWLAVVLSGTIGLGASFVLFLGMLERHGPLAALLALYVTPLAAATLGTLFLGETITLPMVAGGLLILAGLVLFGRR